MGTELTRFIQRFPKEDIAEIKRTIRPYVVDLIYVLILDEKDLNSGEYGVDEE